ncbi:hypothetical protein ABPG72_004718 [Tetrahymena utriculariae]
MIPQQTQMINDLQNFRSHLRISRANRTFENNNDDSIERLQKEYKEFIQNDRRNHQSSYNIPNDQPLDRLESFIDRKLDSRSRNFSNNNSSRIQLKNLMKSEPMQDFSRGLHENTTPQKSINNHILSNNMTPFGFNPELNSYRAPSRSSSYNQEAYSISHSVGYNQQAQENFSPQKNYSHLAYATKLQQLEKQMFAQPYQYQNFQQPANESEQQQVQQPEYKQSTVPIIIEKPVFIEKKIYIEKPIYVEKEIEIPVYKPVYKEVKQEFPYSNPQSDRSNLNLLEQTHSILSSSSKPMSKSPLKRQQTNELAYASPPIITNKHQEVPAPQKNIPQISPGVLKKAKFEGLSFIFDAIKVSLEKILNFNRDLSVALLENKPSQSSDNQNYLGTISSIKVLCLDLMGELVSNLKQINFTQNVKYFFQIYTMEEIAPCQGFHLLFELKRFQFNRSHNVAGKSYNRDNLIISTFFIIRIVINQLLLRYKRYNLQHQEYDFTFINAKIIGSIIYHLIRHNLQYNNPKHNIYSYKIEPLNGNFLLAEDELEQTAEKVPSLYGEDQLIYGMFAQSEIQDIINDDKFLRKFYKFQEQFVQMIIQFTKEQ